MKLEDSLLLAADYHKDRVALAEFIENMEAALSDLPQRAERNGAQQNRAKAIHETARTARQAFLDLHADELYAELTESYEHHLRIENLAFKAAELVPGLVPTRLQIEKERSLPQQHKEGNEIDQGILFNSFLNSPRTGSHLLDAMRRPTAEALSLLSAFKEEGWVDLGSVTLRREDGVGFVTLDNHEYLNAEDDATVGRLETAVDLVLLDDCIKVGVLRGAPMRHPRYANQRVFSAGINLTHLYQGRISLIDFMLRRELGYINKMFRGIIAVSPGQGSQHTQEKPWIGAIDTFSIGGGTQITLVLDRVIAERKSYFTLPAMQEGIVPGAANLRLPRMTGSRLARQSIFFNRLIPADSSHGQLLCDVVADSNEMESAIRSAAAELSKPAVVANRRMLRLAEEPESSFREYMAWYALEQSRLIHSEDMIATLERSWVARAR
ncbi:enoyl-CoA hydratase/isomerase family protein [Streptomyces rhizosphaericus]|uniref:Enoyl-CoA hydratase/isomerase family protein n=1 Tax=Streptomyces rhizosphaericus TaxID=114699 RepID=A0A6G4AYK3_9ACTN|nr:enoyl-CoA hydratase/isomerase family protein [Streptomyces rhizosphaericus]NEW77621.1 enoyl-CoA hydratase/isomerase family protein [Streptomyces rhizosphaericus]